jgi:hypothetical protein
VEATVSKAALWVVGTTLGGTLGYVVMVSSALSTNPYGEQGVWSRDSAAPDSEWTDRLAWSVRHQRSKHQARLRGLLRIWGEPCHHHVCSATTLVPPLLPAPRARARRPDGGAAGVHRCGGSAGRQHGEHAMR